MNSSRLDLQKVMDYSFNVKHNNLSLVAKSKSRIVSNKESVFELFLSGMKKQEYKEYIINNKVSVEDCLLCRPCNSIVYKNYLSIVPDDYPFFPYHLLIRPLKPIILNNKSSTSINKDVKLIELKSIDFDCRNYFNALDIKFMAQLVLETDYMITQSMNGSGASIPKHIHAHAIKQIVTKFPLLLQNKNRIAYSNDGVSVAILEQPTFALVFQGSPDFISTEIAILSERFGFVSNHLIYKESGKLIGIYVPRVKESPNSENFKGWKFGAFEVLGLFDVKKNDQFFVLNYDDLFEAIKDVTIQDNLIRKIIEENAVLIAMNFH